jgi:hypothetical protein
LSESISGFPSYEQVREFVTTRNTERVGLYGLEETAITVPGLEPDATESAHGLGPEPRLRLPELSDPEKEWLRERFSRLESDTEFCKAIKAFGEMSKVNQDGLWPEIYAAFVNNLFPLLACLSISHGPTRKTKGRKPPGESWNRIFAFGTGKTWKALTEFPQRLRQVADEIERLNGSHWFNPEFTLRQEDPVGRVLVKRFKTLPGYLRAYAHITEKRAKWLLEMRRQFYPTTKGFSQYVFRLSEFVKLMTGKFHDKEVVDLLNAAAWALGEEANGEPRFHELALVQARYRRRKTRNT